MRIGVNLLDLIPGHIGGMEQYIRNLIQYSSSRDDVEFYLFLNKQNFVTFHQIPHKITKILIEKKNRGIEFLQEVHDHDLDLLFCPLLNLEPKNIFIPSVVTIPDMQHKFYPEFFSKEALELREKSFEFSVKNADKIITLSEYSKKTIVSSYDVQQEKVEVIYLDASTTFQPDTYQKSKRILRKYKLPFQYIFYPANFWKHKNHYVLIQALSILHTKYRIKVHLVLTGQKKRMDPEILRLIRKEKLSRYIHIIGYIDQRDLQKIFICADILVFPSLFEGFGIPLIEAMRCNCPIVCSDRTSIPEIVGEAALFFNPEDPDDIAEKISLVINNSDIRDELIEKGKIQSLKFSWSSTSDKTLDVFSEIIKNNIINSKIPLVSIITPSYNQGRFIKRTIESVLSQSYPNIEYIIIDGGSTDETVSILQSYKNQFTWISEKDEGQADAVNKGILMAKGDIIGWLNSDDIYAPHAILNAVSALIKNPDIDVVYGEASHISDIGDFIDRYPTEIFNYERLAEYCYICQPSAFIRKDALLEVGCLDKNLQFCMDYDLWMRLGKTHTFLYLPYVIAQSRLYSQNKTLSQKQKVHEEAIDTVYRNYGYVPINWIYGFIDSKLNGKHNIWFYLSVICEFFYINKKNLKYVQEFFKKIILNQKAKYLKHLIL